MLPCLAVLLGSAAGADTLGLLTPPGEVAAEPLTVAIRRVDSAGLTVRLERPELLVEGATASRSAPQGKLETYRLTPRAGAREILVRVRDGELRAEARIVVGPPAARVELALDPPSPVKNRDLAAQLTVKILRPDGTPDERAAPPVLRANVGELSKVAQIAPGVFQGKYVLPGTRYPEVAVLVALSAWPHPQSTHGALGCLRVPLASAIDLTGQAEADAEMTVVIAGTRYGPTRTGGDGRFRLPVVVPPGFGTGLGTTVDRAGNKRSTAVDLMLPPTNQLACIVNPSQLPADGVSKARVICATSDPFGRSMTQTRVTLAHRVGRVEGPQGLAGGILEFLYTAPSGLETAGEVLVASWKSAAQVSRQELRIDLRQGPAARAQLELGESPIHWGGALMAKLLVVDGQGRPRPGAVAHIQAPGGELSQPVEEAGGRLAFRWLSPASGRDGSARVSARVFGPLGDVPAQLVLWARDGMLWAATLDLVGLPVPTQPLGVSRNGASEEAAVTGEDGAVRLGPLKDGRVVVRHAQWRQLVAAVDVFDRGALVFPAAARPLPDEVSAEVKMAPATPVNVRLRVDGRQVLYWVESSTGEVLPGRRVHVALSEGRLGEAHERDGKITRSVEVDRPASISVADLETGVTAVARVTP